MKKKIIRFVITVVGYCFIFAAVDFKRDYTFSITEWERWVIIGLVVIGVVIVHYSEKRHENNT
jgi:hypothetical protein